MKGQLSSWTLWFEIWSSSFNLILHLTVKQWTKHWQGPTRFVLPQQCQPAWNPDRPTNQGSLEWKVEVGSFSKKRPLQWSWSCTEAASIICAPKKRKRQMAIALGILLQWKRPKFEFDVNWAGEISLDFMDQKLLKSCKDWWTQISTLHWALQFLTISALQIIETVRFPAQPLYF